MEGESGKDMIVSGWNNGSPNNRTGAGYRIRISKDDRDRYFRIEWDSVEIELETEEIIMVSLSNSFWNRCGELRSSKIGKWMLENRYAPGLKANHQSSNLSLLLKENLSLLAMLIEDWHSCEILNLEGVI